ncbi:MAG: O-antigen ligase family protein [Phycisphaerae bacterium]|nr:O-antigen ligase family protein [Phycisphaerales bacterium]
MSRLIRIVNPNELKPVHVVMLALVTLGLAGNCLLTSAGKPTVLQDGANAWPADSLLLAIVEILDLQYAQPTPNGIAIKSLVAGTAAGVGLIIAALGIFLRARSLDEATDDDAVIEVDDDRSAVVAPEKTDGRAKKHIDPILASQVLMLLYLAWAFAGTLWSNAPGFAFGGAVTLGVNLAWAFVLAMSLSRRAAIFAGYSLFGVLVVTAGIAGWYYLERNSTLRASYPVGNPLFLAACLIPGMLIAISCVARVVSGSSGAGAGRRVAMLAIFALGCGVIAWAFYLTQSRGPAVALGLGVFAVAAFAGGRDVKLVAAVMGIIGIAVVGIYFLNQHNAPSVTGRSQSMRVRLYTWNYAMDLFGEKPLTGHGLGGYALLADGLAKQDVLADPEALGSRISHAHGEWFEVASDLGGIGLVLVLGALFLAIYGATGVIPDLAESAPRWMLIGLSATLAALIVEECFDVGLQISGLPFVFYTVLGLVWALARPLPASVYSHLGKRRWLGWLMVVGAMALGLCALEYSRRDFAAARALYDTEGALAGSEWNKATVLADSAYENRLQPQRKLVALMQKIAAELYIAEQHQIRYIRRLRIQAGASLPDPELDVRLNEDRLASEQYLGKALADIEFTRSIVSSEMGIGMLEFKLRTIRAVFAEIDGRTDDVQKEGLLAADALGAQLERQPFESELATKFVIASIGRVEVATAIEVLARPLRMKIASDKYIQAVAVLMSNPEIRSQAMARIDAELAPTDEADVAKRLDAWSPEILRVGAVAAFVQGVHESAVKYLQEATSIYERASKADLRVSLIAYASAHAELADALFLTHPDDPQRAIESAEVAIRVAPASFDGRTLIAALRERIMAYHLAAGHESFVREQLKKQIRTLDEHGLDAEVANRYMKMCYSVLERAHARVPQQLNQWSQRALALDSESAANWFLAADIAILAGDEAQVVERINQAIDKGGDAQDIYAIVMRASTAMPNSTLIAGMRRHIERELGIAPEQAEAPQTESPETDVPRTEVPETDVPLTGTPEIETPETVTPKVNEDGESMSPPAEESDTP